MKYPALIAAGLLSLTTFAAAAAPCQQAHHNCGNAKAVHQQHDGKSSNKRHSTHKSGHHQTGKNQPAHKPSHHQTSKDQPVRKPSHHQTSKDQPARKPADLSSRPHPSAPLKR
ncbi:hypothetical protein [Aeromonas simiae]|uniref:hypothetical protein n=1 Tax=Aeromonas simiae TaxID=218936 RepID=UPI0005A7C327|nr:hypothetical protein [Aeromonas simiae]